MANQMQRLKEKIQASNPGVSSPLASSPLLTYVIRFPDDMKHRRAIVEGIRELVEKHGGEVCGMSVEDEMTILDKIEQHEDFPDYIAEDARKATLELHREWVADHE